MTATVWMVEQFGRGGVAQYAADVGRLLGEMADVRLAMTTGGPGVGYSGQAELWFPRVGPAPFDRLVAGVVGLVRARMRPAPGDVAWVALGFRPRYERLLVAALRRSGCRVLGTVHNRQPHEDAAQGAQVVEAARDCDLVVVHTEAMRTWALAADLPVVRLPFPPPGAGAGEPAGLHSRTSLGLATDVLVVALIGNLRGYKGVDVLLEALGELPLGSPVHVVLAGQTQGWDVAAAAGAAGAEGRLTFLEGYLPHGELLDILDLADAVVLPYRRIDHSGVGALAASRGLPAVASDLPGLRELFGDAAIYVPPGSSSALTAALSQLEGRLDDLRTHAEVRSAETELDGYADLVRRASAAD